MQFPRKWFFAKIDARLKHDNFDDGDAINDLIDALHQINASRLINAPSTLLSLC